MLREIPPVHFSSQAIDSSLISPHRRTWIGRRVAHGGESSKGFWWTARIVQSLALALFSLGWSLFSPIRTLWQKVWMDRSSALSSSQPTLPHVLPRISSTEPNSVRPSPLTQRVSPQLLLSNRELNHSVDVVLANRLLEQALDEKRLDLSIQLEACTSATDLKLSARSFPLSKSTLDSILIHCRQLECITLSNIESSSHASGQNLNDSFEALRYLLVSNLLGSIRLEFKDTQVEKLGALVVHLNEEECIQFYHVLNLNQPQFIFSWINVVCEALAAQDADKLLAIFKQMDSQQLSQPLSNLLNAKKALILNTRLRFDFKWWNEINIVGNLTANQLQGYVQLCVDSGDIHLLGAFIRLLKHCPHAPQEQAIKINYAIQSILASKPNDGSFIYQLFTDYVFREELVVSLADDPANLDLLIGYIKSLVDEGERQGGIEGLVKELEYALRGNLSKRLGYLKLILGASLKEASAEKLSTTMLRKSDRLQVDLCLLQTLEVLNDQTLMEKEPSIKAILAKLTSCGDREKQAFVRDLLLLSSQAAILPLSLLMHCCADQDPSLGEAWLIGVLAKGDLEFIRTAFTAFWNLEAFHGFELKNLIGALNKIDSREKLEIALETLPDSLSQKDRKAFITALITGGFYLVCPGSKSLSCIEVQPEEIREVLAHQTGGNQLAIAELIGEGNLIHVATGKLFEMHSGEIVIV